MSDGTFIIPSEVQVSKFEIDFHNAKQIFEEKEVRIYPVTIEDKTVRTILWGKNNMFPNLIRDELNKSAVGLDCLDFKEKITYGSGIKYGRVEDGEFVDLTGKGVFEEVDLFFENHNNLSDYLSETVNNFHNWGFAVPSVTLNREKDPGNKKIISLSANDVFFCRFKEVDERGYISDAYFRDWAYYQYASRQTDKDPNIDPSHENHIGNQGFANTVSLELLRRNNPLYHLEQLTGRKKTLVEMDSGARMRTKKTRKTEFGLLLRTASTGNSYYPWQPHYSVFENGWMDIANDIPLYKAKKMKNMLQVAYKVTFAKGYWDSLFVKQGITEEEEKKKFVTLQLDNIKKFLHGIENAGKTLIEDGAEITDNGELLERIKIEKIERDVEKGEYLEDSHEASAMIYTAFGVNPNLRAGIPGKDTSNFNGTDKRELLRIAQTLETPLRDMILSPLYLIKRYNGWPKDLKFVIEDIILTTLDQGREVQTITNV